MLICSVLAGVHGDSAISEEIGVHLTVGVWDMFDVSTSKRGASGVALRSCTWLCMACIVCTAAECMRGSGLLPGMNNTEMDNAEIVQSSVVLLQVFTWRWLTLPVLSSDLGSCRWIGRLRNGRVRKRR